MVGAVAECLGRPADDPECTRTAQLMWHLIHGLVSLRIARPFLPWPPLAETVDEAVSRVVEPARPSQGNLRGNRRGAIVPLSIGLVLRSMPARIGRRCPNLRPSKSQSSSAACSVMRQGAMSSAICSGERG